MAVRGRPRKDQADRKSVPLGVRVTPALHDRLEAARAESGRTLSQEMEARLRLSFEDNQRAQERFGGPTNYWLFQWIARGIAIIEQQTGRRWWEDRYTFDECRALIDEIWGFFKRPGRRVVPKDIRSRQFGRNIAVTVIAPLEMVAREGHEFGNRAFNAAAIVTKLNLKTSPLAKMRRAWGQIAKKIAKDAERIARLEARMQRQTGINLDALTLGERENAIARWIKTQKRGQK
jgi:hypothetical protein